MGTAATLKEILVIGTALAWGGILAFGSWTLLVKLVDAMVQRSVRSRSARAAPGWLALGMGKWLLYAGWLYVGIAWLRLSPVAMTLGFFGGWLGALAVFLARSKTPSRSSPVQQTDVSSSELHHGKI